MTIALSSLWSRRMRLPVWQFLLLLIFVLSYAYFLPGFQHLNWSELNFLSGDFPQWAMLFKALVQQGSWHSNAQLAFPQAYADFSSFPFPDFMPRLFVWFLSLFTQNIFQLYHSYMYWCVVLNILGAFFVGRWLGLNIFLSLAVAAGFGGCLFVLSQLHIHPAVSLLPHVPFIVGLAIYLSYLRRGVGEHATRLKAAPAIILCGAVLLGISSAYVLFFGLIVVGSGFLVALFRLPGRHAMLIKYFMLFTVLSVAVYLLLLAPTFVEAAQQGATLPQRHVHEQLMYGLRLGNLFIPYAPGAQELFQQYIMTQPPSTEGWNNTYIGVLGSLGLILVVPIFLAGMGARRAAGSRHLIFLFAGQRRSLLLRAAAFIILACVLFASVYGVGHLFNLLVTPIMRTQSRVMFYLFFVCWIVAAFVIQHFILRRWPASKPYVYGFVFLAVMYGALPSLNLPAAYSFSKAQDVAQERESIKSVLTSLDDGGLQRVANLPLMPYPEARPMNHMESYHQAKLYLYDQSRERRYSYGLMQGTQEWERIKSLNTLPPPMQLQALACIGFDSAVVERVGLADFGAAFAEDKNIQSHRIYGDGLRLVYSLKAIPINKAVCASAGQTLAD